MSISTTKMSNLSQTSETSRNPLTKPLLQCLDAPRTFTLGIKKTESKAKERPSTLWSPRTEKSWRSSFFLPVLSKVLRTSWTPSSRVSTNSHGFGKKRLRPNWTSSLTGIHQTKIMKMSWRNSSTLKIRLIIWSRNSRLVPWVWKWTGFNLISLHGVLNGKTHILRICIPRLSSLWSILLRPPNNWSRKSLGILRMISIHLERLWILWILLRKSNLLFRWSLVLCLSSIWS